MRFFKPSSQIRNGSESSRYHFDLQAGRVPITVTEPAEAAVTSCLGPLDRLKFLSWQT